MLVLNKPRVARVMRQLLEEMPKSPKITLTIIGSFQLSIMLSKIVIIKAFLLLSSRLRHQLATHRHTQVKYMKKILMKKVVQVQMLYGREQALRVIISIKEKFLNQYHP